MSEAKIVAREKVQTILWLQKYWQNDMILITVEKAKNVVLFFNEEVKVKRVESPNSPSVQESRRDPFQRIWKLFLWVTSTHEKPPPPARETNTYCASYESTMELAALVGFQEPWKSPGVEERGVIIKYQWGRVMTSPSLRAGAAGGPGVPEVHTGREAAFALVSSGLSTGSGMWRVLGKCPPHLDRCVVAARTKTYIEIDKGKGGH